MEIEIIKSQQQENLLDNTKHFGIILNKSISIIKMLHWYTNNYNVHVLLGKLYDDLTDLFDKLQEEIIGTSQEYNQIFPYFSSALIQLDDLDQYKQDENIANYYYNTVNKIKELLTSLEFNNYISSVKSGLTNTKEDIITRINKTNYLLSKIEIN